MFEFLKNILVDNRIPSITFLEFYQKIFNLREAGVFPYDYNLPQAISFPESFWKEIVLIHKMTLKDGSEREISIFLADGDLIFTSVVKGNERSVTSNHNVSVNYIPHPTKKGYFRKEVYLDGSIYKRKDIYYKDAPKEVSIQYLFNLHTHPRQSLRDGETVFSFFSEQDIKTQLQSKAIVSGLVTDKLWLVVRTDKTPSVIMMEEKDISVETLKNSMSMIVYCAEISKRAVRQ